jgi:KEOPS complex subunit Cgi121
MQEDTPGDQYRIVQVRFQVPDIPSFLETLRKIGKTSGCRIICFNRKMMAGRRHVCSAVEHAIRSFGSGTAIARSLEVEALLYAAGTRQTGLIGDFGIHAGENECYLCLVPGSDTALRDLIPLIGEQIAENWESMDADKEERLVAFFGITGAEIGVVGKERIVDLILERVALLAVYS